MSEACSEHQTSDASGAKEPDIYAETLNEFGRATELPKTLRSQVEYYMSDENLKRDKFFQNVIAQTEGGWIGMQMIVDCPKMKEMGATVEAVCRELQEHPDLELREAPLGSEAVRRRIPPPPLEQKSWRAGR